MKESTLKIAIIGIVFLIGLIGISTAIMEKRTTTDGKKFKEEYESYNNQENSSKTNTYLELSIPEDNPMKYATLDEIMKVLKDGTGIIYFGRPTCPWCRNAVPILIEAAKQEGLEEIYYFDMDTIKNEWQVIAGEVKKTKEEKEGYYDLLKRLDEELDPYTITDKDGNIYEVGEKRVYVPMVLCVENGEVLASHVGTVDLNDGQTSYDALTSEQHDALLKIYVDYIQEIKDSNYCDEACE